MKPFELKDDWDENDVPIKNHRPRRSRLRDQMGDQKLSRNDRKDVIRKWNKTKRGGKRD